MGESVELTHEVPVPPSEVYTAWTTPKGHRAMTGGKATGDAVVGAAFTAWDGYIRGAYLALEPERRIVQSWRTSEFPTDAPDSRLEVALEPTASGTRLTLRHTGLPPGGAKKYGAGWNEHYFAPMTRHFAKPAKKTVAAYLAAIDGWRGEVARQVAELVRAAAPDAEEAIKWAQPVWSSNGPCVWMKAHTRHVNLGFWRGADLPDPDRRLSGTGERMAHLKLHGPEDVRPDEITAFVRAAVALNAERGDPTKRR
jgi:hypothetical protein